jgi:hypothetical protein
VFSQKTDVVVETAREGLRGWGGGAALQLDVMQSMLDCLYAKCTPYITDCVMAELEKLGQKYRVALRIAKVGGYIG